MATKTPASKMALMGLSAALFSSVAATTVFAQGDAPLIKSMQQAGGAKVAIAAAPPYAFLLPSGEPQGYLIEVSAAVLEKLGVAKVNAVSTTWDAMIPGLQAKQFDFVPAGLNITEARCKVVLFSAPISVHQDGLFVMPGNPKKLTGYDSGKSPDIRLAVLAGSSQEAYALRRGVNASQLVRVPDIQAGIAAVRGGRAEGFALGQFSVTKPAERGVELVLDTTAPLQGIAIAFRRDDQATRDAFNTEFDKLKKAGTIRDLYEKKYGFTTYGNLEKTSAAKDVEASCE